MSTAADWLTGTLMGTVATALCIIAVGFVGLMLMSGRLAVRDAARVVLGCFVLLGASIIAQGLRDVTSDAAPPVPVENAAAYPPTPPGPPPPVDYDPYLGASPRGR